MSSEVKADRPLRAGIVGGGQGAFIGRVHRMAVELDGAARIVAGALSSDPARNRASAAEWFLDRAYDSYATMAMEEAKRPDGIDFVIIATPNHLHFPVAKAFLDAGIHVVCDKPIALSVDEATTLKTLAEQRSLVFGLTHTYTGYPAVIEARERVRSGQVGEVRKVLVEYLQDWLMDPLESTGQKQASWRTDPKKSGESGCVADIGTHCENLLEFITGLEIKSLCADFRIFVEGRLLDDDANILLRMNNGATGVLTCSQVACGESNGLSIRIYGSEGGLEWHQQDPNILVFKPKGQPHQRLEVGNGYMGSGAKGVTRLPSGHPEGYIEAFATLYRSIIRDIWRHRSGVPLARDYPTAADGVRGLAFLACAIDSARRGAQWVDL
ncbi:MAG: Gfo/Idh/MocA family oxidoreductase [Steroidobacteraceae bacterium]